MSKAFRFQRHGGPEVLRFEEVDPGEPAPGQVRIRNKAVAVNYRDVLIRRGVHAVASFPSGIGLESAGVIEAVGLEVSDFSVGDRVAYAGRPEGSYAHVRVVPAARLIVLPERIDERTAAAMMIRGMTARALLRDGVVPAQAGTQYSQLTHIALLSDTHRERGYWIPALGPPDQVRRPSAGMTPSLMFFALQ